MAINSPFNLWRDVVRVPQGTVDERFNATAVVLETNDRFCGRAEVSAVLEGAIRQVVATHREGRHGTL